MKKEGHKTYRTILVEEQLQLSAFPAVGTGWARYLYEGEWQAEDHVNDSHDIDYCYQRSTGISNQGRAEKHCREVGMDSDKSRLT